METIQFRVMGTVSMEKTSHNLNITLLTHKRKCNFFHLAFSMLLNNYNFLFAGRRELFSLLLLQFYRLNFTYMSCLYLVSQNIQ